MVDGLPDLSHPALNAAAIEVLDAMVPPDGGVDEHGTSVCSLIFGSGAVRGLAPACTGLVLPIFFGGRGDAPARPASQLDLARAITFALEHDVSIINVSAGQKSWTVEPEAHLEQALDRCVEKRVLVVGAAGNDGCPCFHLPAGCQFVLAVGALDAAGRPLESSNWGEPYLRNGLLAPGENLAVAALDGGTSTARGTSFATAVVAAAAALLASVAQREGYRIDPLDVAQILIDSAVPCRLGDAEACRRYLAGTLDARAALEMLHRIGNAARSPPLVRAAGLSIQGDATLACPIAPVETGEEVMSDAMSQSSETIAVTSPELVPAAEQSEKEVVGRKPSVGPQSAAAARSAPFPMAQSAGTSALSQQSCGCGCSGGEPPQIVYALGSLWFDFGTEARHDAIVQQIGYPIAPLPLFDFLAARPEFLAGITFILMQDQIPIYAIQPAGPFALLIYNTMLDALRTSLDAAQGDDQRISLPGFIAGSTRLMNGMTVPVVYPDQRGMWKWTSQNLIDVFTKVKKKAPSGDDLAGFENYLNRIYYEMRNLGVAPQDRAVNFAATNAYQAGQAFEKAFDQNGDPQAPSTLFLQAITPRKSPICRPDSDCWDVEITFFDPVNTNRSVLHYRFTVDVSEVLPVTIGKPRWWWAPG